MADLTGRRNVRSFGWGLLALAVSAWLLRYPPVAPQAIAGWGVLIATGLLVNVPANSGNRLSLGFAVVAAMPLLLRQGGGVDMEAVLVTMILGLGLAWIARLIRQEGGRFLLAAEMARRGLGMLLYLSVFAVVEALLEGWATELRGAELAAFMVAGASWFVLDTWLWASLTYGRRVVSRRYLWLLAISDWMVALSLMATGALFAFSWRPLGPWAVLVAAVPYSFAHAGVHRYHMARRTYRQTIRALARIPEVAGLSGDGHAERTAELAVLTSQEMGLGPDLVSQIEYAALMHDIGRITLNEPTILRMGFTDEDIAGWGADIVAEAPYLSRVATFVRHQHQPYRRPGEHSDPDLPIASKIIRAASAYDHAVGELGFSALEGLETLHRGAAYDFDPDVVAAMRRVVAAGTVSGEGRSRLRP